MPRYFPALLVSLLLQITLAHPSHAQTYHRAAVSIVVDADLDADVVSTYSMSHTPRLPLKHIAILFVHQHIDRVIARFNQAAVNSQLQKSQISWILTTHIIDTTDASNEPTLTIRYSLSLRQNARIPVFVPSISDTDASGDIPTDLTVLLPPQFSAGPDTFPRLVHENGRYTASLPSLPGLLYLPIRKAADAAPWDPLLTVGGLTNAGFFILVLCASVYWAVLRRRALREISKRQDKGAENGTARPGVFP